jgi:hypothetical protein
VVLLIIWSDNLQQAPKRPARRRCDDSDSRLSAPLVANPEQALCSGTGRRITDSDIVRDFKI